MRTTLRKTVAASLSGLLLVQVSLAHAADSRVYASRNGGSRSPAANDFWSERKARRAGPLDAAPQLASLTALPNGQTQSFLSSLPPLRAALPAAKRANDGPSQASEISTGLQSLVASIPSAAGSVQDVYDAGDGALPPVVIIQDVHLNPEAQANIASILETLVGQNKVGLVGVEGAFAPFDFRPFRSFSDRQVMTGVADDFLKSGLLAAPSHVGITSAAEPPLFVGIDDRDHYDANVKAYLATRDDKDRTVAALRERQGSLAGEKRRMFSKDLLAFDDLRVSYQSGQIGIGSYLTQLRKFSPGFNVATEQFLAAYQLEQDLDFRKVENERRQVLEKLTRAMTEAELRELVARSVAHRLGQLNFADFYRQLKDLCAAKGVPLSDAPAFDRYVRYVLLSDGIKADDLLTGVDAAERQIAERLVKAPEERRLLALSEKLTLAQKLTDFALTPPEWARYQSNDAALAGHGLAAFETFYREADTRSLLMLGNLRKPRTDRSRVLVMGGFHTPEIASLLRNQKTSFVVVSPKITKIDTASGSAYLSVFAQEKTPLDKIFAGQRLFLAPEAVQITWRTTAFRLLASAAARIGRSTNVTVRMPERTVRAQIDVDRQDATRDQIQVASEREIPLSDGGRSRTRLVALFSVVFILSAPFLLGPILTGNQIIDSVLYAVGFNSVTITGMLLGLVSTRTAPSAERSSVSPGLPETTDAVCNFLDDVHNINGYFAGDGAGAFAYTGALYEMERRGKWFNRVGGTSIGALFAVLVSAGYDASGIRTLLLETDFRKFRDRRWRFLPASVNLLLFGGRYKGEALKQWVNKVVGDKLSPTDDAGVRRDPTMQDLAIPLKVVLTDLDTRQAMIIEGGPGTGLDNVGEVIAAAMGYATVFEQKSLRGKRVAQAGMFPGGKLHLPVFDEQIRDEEVVKGFSIVPEAATRSEKTPSLLRRILGFALRTAFPAGSFFARLADTYRDTLSYEQHDPDGKMTVPIRVPWTGQKKLFTLTRAEKEELAKRGAEATRAYFDQNGLQPAPVVSSQRREPLHPGEDIDAFFMGGGGKGFVYIGALKTLAEQGITVKDVAGTSVGSAFACLVAAGFDWKEIQELFIANNLLDLVEDRRWAAVLGPIRWLRERLAWMPSWMLKPLHWAEEAVDIAFKVLNLRKRGGMFRSDALVSFISTALKEKLKDRLQPGEEPLMEHLPNLKVVVSDLSADSPEKKVVVINSQDPINGAVYGKVPIAVAVAASMGLPVLFEPPDLGKWVPALKGHILTDGGAVYPGNYLPSVHEPEAQPENQEKRRRVVGFYLNVPRTGEPPTKRVVISLLRKIPLVSVLFDVVTVYLVGMGYKAPATTTADTVLPVDVTKGVGLTKFVLTESEWEEAILSGENSVKRRLQRSGFSQVRATVRSATLTPLFSNTAHTTVNSERYRMTNGESLDASRRASFERAVANLKDAIADVGRLENLSDDERRTLADMSFLGLWSPTTLLVQEESTRYAFGTLRMSRTRRAVYLPMGYWGAEFDADRKAMAALALEFSVKWRTRYAQSVPPDQAPTSDPEAMALRSYQIQSQMLLFERTFWETNREKIPASFPALRAALVEQDRKTLADKRRALEQDFSRFEDQTNVLQGRILTAFQNPANYRQGRNEAGERVRVVDIGRVSAELAPFLNDILEAKFYMTELTRRASAIDAPISNRVIERAKIFVALDSIHAWEDDVVRTMRELLSMDSYRELEDILRNLANGQMMYRLPTLETDGKGPSFAKYRVPLDSAAMERIREAMRDQNLPRSLYDNLVERTNAEMDFIDRENRLQAYARTKPLADRIMNGRPPASVRTAVAEPAMAPGLIFGKTGRPWLDRGAIPLLEELVFTGIPLLTGQLWLFVVFRIAFVVLHAVFGRDGPVSSFGELRQRLTSLKFVRENLTLPFLISLAVSVALVGTLGFDLSSLDAGAIASFVMGATLLHSIANARVTPAERRTDEMDAGAEWLAQLGAGIAGGRVADILGQADAWNVEELVGQVGRDQKEAALLARIRSWAANDDFQKLLTEKLTAKRTGPSTLAPAEQAEVLLALVLARANGNRTPADAKDVHLLLYKGDGNAEVTRVGVMARLMQMGLGNRTMLIVDADSRRAAADALALMKKAGLPVQNIDFNPETILPAGDKPASSEVDALIQTRQPTRVFVQGFEFISPIATILPPIDSIQLGNLLKVMRAVMIQA